MNRFFIELSAHDLLRNEMIADTTNLLVTVVNHPSIPKNASFRIKALFLMSTLLNPIIRIKKTYQRNSNRFTVPQSFMSCADSAIKILIKHIATGLESSRFCCPIAEELTFAIENNFEELSGNQNLMQCYNTMLEKEVKLMNRFNVNILNQMNS